jgi:glycosyltransferase involved in cell wall biosynthesis
VVTSLTQIPGIHSIKAKDTIAFISAYEHPSRDSMERTMRDAFPEYRLEIINAFDLLKANRRWRLPNLYHLAAEYGVRIAMREATVRGSYYRTSYLFHAIRHAMANRIDPARHVFSFQVQSNFDASVPEVPHFIYTDHTHLSNLAYSFFNRRELRPQRWLSLEKLCYHNAAHVFTRSHNITADLIKHYALPQDKVTCVFAGANVPAASNYQVANNNYSNKRILFIGSEWVRKGGPLLAEAFQKVLSLHPDAHLTIVGASPRLNLPNCTVLGQVPLAELSAHFAQSSIFCLPTRIEPFGVAILDAMLHRLPVVATSVGAIPDMIQEGISGHMVTPGDSHELAQALLGLLRDPARCQRFGTSGYRLANARYTWPSVGTRLRAEILRFLENRSALAADASAVSSA